MECSAWLPMEAGLPMEFRFGTAPTYDHSQHHLASQERSGGLRRGPPLRLRSSIRRLIGRQRFKASTLKRGGSKTSDGQCKFKGRSVCVHWQGYKFADYSVKRKA